MALVAILLASVALAAPAKAAFPGANGDIVGGHWSADAQQVTFSDVGFGDPNVCEPCYFDIYVQNADGSGRRDLTPNGEFYDDLEPAWSPDGRKIAYHVRDWTQGTDLFCIVNAVGTPTGSCPAGPQSGGGTPSWSPDGTRIAYVNGSQVWTYNYPGGGTQPLTTTGNGFDPDWSPNSSQIVFDSTRDGNYEIYKMNRDGSGQTRLTTNTADDRYPVWSPDGTKIAFLRNYRDLYTINIDGTGESFVRSGVFGDIDWKAVNPGPYTRPIGTALSRWSLGPTFKPCTAANASHGSALAGASCNPPAPTSSLVAVGPRSLGLTQFRTLANGECPYFDPTRCFPDFTIRFNVTDVRSGGPTGPDYDASTWDLTGTATLPGPSGKAIQITDKDNQSIGDPSGPYDKAATVTPLSFPIPVDCAPTADTSIGSTCNVQTTANTLLPGAVAAGKRGVWELGQIQLLDRGPDGTPGNADDQLFEAQGVFLP